MAIVTLKTDSATEPAVSEESIELILTTHCQLEDEDGLAPDHDDWTGTYDLHLAEAQVFEIKASKVTTHFDFSSDGSRFNRKQKIDSFLAMAKLARSRRHTSFGNIEPEPLEEVIVADA